MSKFFPRRLPWLLGLSAVDILADRLTKEWVELHIPLGGAIPVIPRVLRITHWTNEGAAFSLFAQSASPQLVRWTLVSFSLVAALAVLIASCAPWRQVHDDHDRTRAHLCRRAGQRTRPHSLWVSGRLYRSPHLQLPLARFQCSGFIDRDRRMPAAARFSCVKERAGFRSRASIRSLGFVSIESTGFDWALKYRIPGSALFGPSHA